MTPLETLSFTQWMAVIAAAGTFLSITVIPIVIQVMKAKKLKEEAPAASTGQPTLPMMGMPTASDISLLIAQVREMQGQILDLQREVERLESENSWLKKMLEKRES